MLAREQDQSQYVFVFILHFRSDAQPYPEDMAGHSDGRLVWGAASVLALLESIALAVHLQDMHVVGEPVQQSAGRPFRSQHFGPFQKRQRAVRSISGTRMADKASVGLISCLPRVTPNSSSKSGMKLTGFARSKKSSRSTQILSLYCWITFWRTTGNPPEGTSSFRANSTQRFGTRPAILGAIVALNLAAQLLV
jgi:hypothetical protein